MASGQEEVGEVGQQLLLQGEGTRQRPQAGPVSYSFGTALASGGAVCVCACACGLSQEGATARTVHMLPSMWRAMLDERLWVWWGCVSGACVRACVRA